MSLPNTDWTDEELPVTLGAVPLTDHNGDPLYAQDGTPLYSQGAVETAWTDE